MTAPIRLQTHVWNPQGDRRALLLHGLGSDGACWWRLASALADDGWMVVAPDLRGHGRSPAASVHTVAAFAADVALLGDGHDLVVGHSLGGSIAALLLASSGFARSAVLVDPVLSLPADQRAPLREQLLAETGHLDVAAVKAANPRWHDRDVQRVVLAAAMVTPDLITAVFDDNDPWDVTQHVPTWSARIHLLVADPLRGGLLDPDHAEELADGARVSAEVVGDCGHSIQRERPDVVADAVRRVTAQG